MKKTYMLIILISSLIGLLIGYLLRDEVEYENSIVNKDKVTYKSIKELKKEVRSLSKEKAGLERDREILKSEIIDEKYMKEIIELKRQSSYEDEKGEGLQLTIDAIDESIGNIANLVDHNKILINLINELKANGSEFIAINNQRINQYTGIVLAGNHINVNSVPIAPPYIIDVIGNEDNLRKYKTKGSKYIKYIEENYPIYISVSNIRDIKISKLDKENKLEYIRGE